MGGSWTRRFCRQTLASAILIHGCASEGSWPYARFLSSGRNTRCPGLHTLGANDPDWKLERQCQCRSSTLHGDRNAFRLRDVGTCGIVLEAERYVGWVEGYASRLRRNILKHELRISKKQFSNGIFLPLFAIRRIVRGVTCLGGRDVVGRKSLAIISVRSVNTQIGNVSLWWRFVCREKIQDRESNSRDQTTEPCALLTGWVVFPESQARTTGQQRPPHCFFAFFLSLFLFSGTRAAGGTRDAGTRWRASNPQLS